MLQQLKGGARTLPELCEVLDAPRTTLLHHLALLRGAGLIDLTVTAGEANVYRLRPEGFEQLAQAAKAFPLCSEVSKYFDTCSSVRSWSGFPRCSPCSLVAACADSEADSGARRPERLRRPVRAPRPRSSRWRRTSRSTRARWG